MLSVILGDKISRIIKRLRSEDEEVRHTASMELDKLGRSKQLRTNQGIRLLQAAAEEFPDDSDGFWNPQANLVWATVWHPAPEYLSVVLELLPRYSPKAREAALRMICGIETDDAAEAFVDQLEFYANEISEPSPLIELQRRPHHPDVFFPRLLKFTSYQLFANDVYLTAIEFAKRGMLSSEVFAAHCDLLVENYRTVHAELEPMQRESGSAWMWEDDYTCHRYKAELLLDLFGYALFGNIKGELLRALELKDPRLRCFATISLFRHGDDVQAHVLETIAACPESRNLLYNEMEKLERADQFPKLYLNQEAFAESEIVGWLAFPTELGQAPDEIVLEKTISVDTKGPDGILDYYVFRFRTFDPHWAAKDGWMAGIAGPFLRDNAPSPVAYGGTFSEFQPWAAKTPDEHFEEINSFLNECAKHWSRDR